MHDHRVIKQQFLLDPNITYLNFGSFGACPRPVFEKYQSLQLDLEREPVQFIAFDGPKALARSRKALADFVACDADDLVLVPNPSYAVNIIAKSLKLRADDEILTTDLEYGACEKTWNWVSEQTGAKLVYHKAELPYVDSQSFVQGFVKKITKQTKIIFISHITSSTSLVLPVDEICRAARERNIFCFVDGAHAPAHVPLNLNELDADFYTGACHKWMMTPKGCSFLYVRKDRQELVEPLVVSWGYGNPAFNVSRFIDHNEGQGTRDFSAYLTIESAIQFMQQHNWKQVSDSCKQLVRENADRFASLLETPLLDRTGADSGCQMLSLRVNTPEPEKLQRHLFTQYRIEIPVMRHGQNNYLRFSINGFNGQEDLDKLHEALTTIKSEGIYIRHASARL